MSVSLRPCLIGKRHAAILAAAPFVVTSPANTDQAHGSRATRYTGTIECNQNGTVLIEWSDDGSDWTTGSSQSWTGGTDTTLDIQTIHAPWCKITFTPAADSNSSTRVRVYAHYGD